ncbi:hypothetical protein CHCC20488_2446 [Bacillus paralicheniformis]|uniref:Uncharacterized protein n=1 Tax=Bacillus paralicheniformis TaxID=1648923 RepID=A0ABY3FY32_9BACI|nr:hypothetical protein SC10_B2orf04319 [Bacillus paralicheniformis]ETB73242.1 hypothetical protein A943_01400 [Bacillus sp. CPSM8]KUL11065.1 hypothetical protein LI7559_10180 [Bacillus licheniformis LMG 7559]OLF99787.1 hypothetical protein B4125_4465 [Bacillus paralicheniformis]TWJ66316.1 hypothetical protein CHCC5021_0592 [Bacillus paralicheniformis]
MHNTFVNVNFLKSTNRFLYATGMYRHLGRKKVIVGRFGLDSKEEKTRKSGH